MTLEQLWITVEKAVAAAAPVALAASFVWGILSVILSPCHLASIPLVIGFISDQGKLTTRRAFLLSLLFGTGILVTIGIVGVVTAALGRMMGDTGRWGNYAVAAVLFIVGLHLIGVIPMPFSGPGQVGMKRKGLLASFVLGLVFGIALGPCTFAFMTPVLTFSLAAASKNAVYAVALLATYGIGHCAVIVAAGTSSQAVQGYLDWNEKSRAVSVVKRICGALVIAGAAYLVYVVTNGFGALLVVVLAAAEYLVWNRSQSAANCLNKALLTVAVAALWYLVYRNLQPAADWLIYDLIGLKGHIGSALAFFVYEVPKVLMLLVLVVFGVGIIRTFFTPERTRQLLAGRREYVGNVLAAMLGIVTPFCSCSAVPLFLGFVESGVPLGVTLSFLIAAPMINEIAIVLLFGMFGWKVTAAYIGTGLIIAVMAGWVIGRLKLERFVEKWVYESQASGAALEGEKLHWSDRVTAGRDAVREIVGKVWPYVVAGIAVGAGIHGYVPEGLMASFMGKSAWWSVPLAVAMGVPMYSNAAGIVPVVSALLEKGASLGTALAFMMAVIGLSLPEVIILRKVLRPQLIGVFVGVIAVGITLVGYLFNYVF